MNDKNKLSNRDIRNLLKEEKGNNKVNYSSQLRNQFDPTHERWNSITPKCISDTQSSFSKLNTSTMNIIIKPKTQNKWGLVAAEKIQKHSSLFVDQFDNEFHKKIEKLYERSLETQKKLQEIFGELNENYKYFHESGWLVPNELFPQELIDIKNKNQANEFMMNNIIHKRKLLFVSLKNCLNQDEMPDSIRLLLNDIINSLEKDDESYKIMLPTIFSILDVFATRILNESETYFDYLNHDAVKKLTKKVKKISKEKNSNYNSIMQFEKLMTTLKNKYYPENSNENMEKLTRNSVAHGSFDYTNYTIHDFAKVALLIEHISGLRDFLEENSSNSL